MPDQPLSDENREIIRKRKREYWTQEGIGREYHALALDRAPRTRLKNILDLSVVRRYLAGKTVLDAGAGTGRFTIPLRSSGLSAMPIDISREMLRAGREASQQRSQSFPCAQCDLASLPFRDETFDSVMAMTVLRHFPDWPDLLLECARVARPGGRIIFDLASGEQHLFRESLGVPELSPSQALKTAENYEAAATVEQVRQRADELDLSLITACSHDVLTDNRLLDYLLGEEKDAFYEALDALLASAGAIQAIEFFMRRIAPHMSPAIAPSVMVVMEKPSAGRPRKSWTGPPRIDAAPDTMAGLLRAVLGEAYPAVQREWEGLCIPESCQLVSLVEKYLSRDLPLRLPFWWPE